jgi:hypothetical protein
MAEVYGGRLYYFNGTSWGEENPNTAANYNWNTVAIDSTGAKMSAGIYTGRLYTKSLVTTAIKAVNTVTQSTISKVNSVTKATIKKINGVSNQ